MFADVDPGDVHAVSGRARARHHAGAPAPSCRRTSTASRATWGRSSTSPRATSCCVIEDCAHALGATWNGRPVGTLGDAGFFSFQTLKPLNCYGGGLALVRDAAVAARVRALAEAERWPDEKRVNKRLLIGRLQRIFIRPWVFTISAFPILWVSSLIGANPDVYLWEDIRSLDPLPDAYTERFPNVQAAIGLAALDALDGWTEQTRRHARVMDRALEGLPGIAVPVIPPGRTHVYYQVPASTVRSGTSSSCAACGAASTSRRCTWTSAATSSCSPARRSSRPAHRAPERPPAPCSFRSTPR